MDEQSGESKEKEMMDEGIGGQEMEEMLGYRNEADEEI